MEGYIIILSGVNMRLGGVLRSAALGGRRRHPRSGVHATPCARRHDDTDAESGRRPVSIDRILHVLRNQRRRRVLVYLSSNSATTRSDLAEHVAPLENGVSVADLTTTQRKRVYVSLHRSHHPTLDEAGALVYDSDRGPSSRRHRPRCSSPISTTSGPRSTRRPVVATTFRPPAWVLKRFSRRPRHIQPWTTTTVSIGR